MRNFRSSNPNASKMIARRRPAHVRSICVAAVAMFAVAAAFPAMSANNKNLDDVMASMAAANKAAAKSQQQIDDLTDKTQDAATKYAEALAAARSYEHYSKTLSGLVQAQQERIASIKRQMQQIDVTKRGIQPLMANMVQTLAKFVKLDLPFLPKEREKRIQDLEDLMTRPDVSISEKYRVILQDYLAELDYGRTLSSYDGTLGTGQNARAVKFVHIGRVSLMYQTLDGSETGYWNRNEHKWVVDDDYADAFQNALNMANNKGTPQLLTVPVPAPQPASQAAQQGAQS
ncbi:MAG TPA: DUF3450 domain-containing protein [Gammaproteobacteria bacterium]|nr:DUF3450 domain-containing protein [Gammaproteobacteria bacterium]